jgi:2-polyprenyl-3-methyl-5-hydroxy-6-metoxy-1,4-benzoquinol methylase
LGEGAGEQTRGDSCASGGTGQGLGGNGKYQHQEGSQAGAQGLRHAEEFAARTRDLDMTAVYEEFLPLVLPGGHILDAGCGTGRDSAAFLQRGFKVTAFDASKALVEMATGLASPS